MKYLLLALIATACSASAFAQVSPEEHAGHHPQQPAGAQGVPPTPAASRGERHAELRQKMKTMDDLMEKIETTTGAAERGQLLAGHRKMMLEQLASMKKMECKEGMAGGMRAMSGAGRSPDTHSGAAAPAEGGHAMKDAEGKSPSMMECHGVMQQRLEMLTGMMEHMLRREDARARH